MFQWDTTTLGAALAGLLVAATAFLRREIRRNGDGNGLRQRIDSMAWKIEELHRMHDVRDNSGRPVWYVPPGFDERLNKLLEAVETNARATDKLVDAVKRLCDHVAKGEK